MRFFFLQTMSVEFDRIYVSVGPLAFAGLLILLFALRRRKRSLPYLFCAAVFGVYVLYAVDKLFFPLGIGGGYAEARRASPFWSDVNFTPFFMLSGGALRLALPALTLNLAVTVPLGFGLNFLWPMQPRCYLWLGPLVGLGIEAVQLIISFPLGYLYRVIDIDDALMNALGVWVGYGLFRLFAWLYTTVLQGRAFWPEGRPA